MSVGSVSSSASALFVQSVFDRTDADGDGTLSLDEVLASARQDGADKAGATAAFQDADSDQDGAISRTELASIFERMSNDTRQGLIDAQETANSATTSAEASAQYGAAAGQGGSPPAGGGGGGGGGGAGGVRGGGGGSGGGGGGAGGAGGTSSQSDSTTTDPADANGDGIVTAAEQQAYDLSHPAEAAADAATDTTAASLDLAA